MDYGNSSKVTRGLPWLIKRFTGPQTEFLFIEEKDASPPQHERHCKSSGVLPHVLTGGVRTLSLFPCDLWFQKRFPIADRNGEIRSAELAHHGEVNSYNLALVIEKWTARAARSGLRIVDDLVR